MSEIVYCSNCEKPILNQSDIIWAEGDLPFCPDCAEDELEECGYCHDLRFPEHLFEYENLKQPHSVYNGERMCIGCIDEAYEKDCNMIYDEDV